MAKFKVTFKLHNGTVETSIGQEAKTLLLLDQKGAAGVVAFDFRGVPPFRLPAYIWSLRRKGLTIETRPELHDGGWHGRFVLQTEVEIISITVPALKPELEAA